METFVVVALKSGITMASIYVEIVIVKVTNNFWQKALGTKNFNSSKMVLIKLYMAQDIEHALIKIVEL